MKIQYTKLIFGSIVSLVSTITSRTAENLRENNVAESKTEVVQPTPFQFIRYRDQEYAATGLGYGSDDLEFFNSLDPSSFNEVDSGENVKLLAPVYPGYDRPLLYNDQSFISIKIFEGYLVVGVHRFSISTGRLYVNYAGYNVLPHNRFCALPVIG